MITTLQASGALSAFSDGTTIDALTTLQRVADRDVGTELLDWLCKRDPSGDVLAVALRTLTSCSSGDLADRIFAKPEYLRYFSAPGIRRASGQTTLRTLMGRPLPAEMFADTPFSPAELFFRDLLRSDPMRNADRLVDHREDADISRPLAALCDVAFNPQDDTVVQFTLWRLAESDETQGILTSTLRAIPDFQRRMRPHFEQALDRLASHAHADAVARVRTSMDAAIPQQRAPLPDPSVLANLWKVGPVNLPGGSLGISGIGAIAPSPTRDRVSIRLTLDKSSGSVVRLTSGLVLLFITAFIINADIAAGASLGLRLLSRGLSLFAAIIVCGTIGYVYRSTTQQFTDRTKPFAPPNVPSDTLRQNAPMLALFAAYAVYDAHVRYVGPLHFWNQSLVFVLNSVAIFLIARAFEPDSRL